MSKKKATMTLKDFHGGSIPSDLPLPSAPGVTVRPVDRGGFDRQGSWGNSMGRSDHRLRPASAGSSRNLDEKTPFLSHSSHIGRNFDEDERKPLDGASGPRRTVGDDSFRAQTSRVGEPKTDNLPGARVGNRAASSPAYQISSGLPGSSYAGRVGEVHNASFWIYPNAWGLGKETTIKKEPAPAAWSAPDAASKLAHASALEKVSSGRWSSQKPGNPVKDAEVLGHTESEAEFEHNANNIYSKKTYNRLDVAGDSKNYDIALSLHPSGKSGGTQFQSTLPSESSERPKLKLLPRSKPLENLELPVDYKQGYEQTSSRPQMEDIAVYGPKSPIQSSVAGSPVGDRTPERPKLNLKPRSQPLEQHEGNGEAKRGTVFGGARPREVVLKERGIEDDVSNYESQPPVRVKEASPKADTFLHVTPASYSEKAEEKEPAKLKFGETIRTLRSTEISNRSSHKRGLCHQRLGANQSSMRSRPPLMPRHCDTGKQLQQLSLPRPSQKSVSDPTVADRLPGPRGIPSRNQMPFSRLMGPTPRPQINGY
ncbi:UNVERIFIED_CONTAM: hypothetical protein Sradi_6004300 [Sesamum radiatum]|uniref:Uncharacterized protein n=1 Tax=Sesamum radiatum TaxID=300843 RepID=A0AAW2KG12_SESRA